jgi:hypothetical protein
VGRGWIQQEADIRDDHDHQVRLQGAPEQLPLANDEQRETPLGDAVRHHTIKSHGSQQHRESREAGHHDGREPGLTERRGDGLRQRLDPIDRRAGFELPDEHAHLRYHNPDYRATVTGCQAGETCCA